MAALTLSSIPSNINSYERLAVWCIQCLQDIANGATVNVVQNEPASLAAQCQFTVTADGRDRAVLSAYVPINRNDLNSSTQKTWMAATDIATTAPAAVLLTN